MTAIITSLSEAKQIVVSFPLFMFVIPPVVVVVDGGNVGSFQWTILTDAAHS